MDRRRLIERLYVFGLDVGLSDQRFTVDFLASLARLADRVDSDPRRVAAVELPEGNTVTRDGAVKWLRACGVVSIPEGPGVDPFLTKAASTFHTVALARSGHGVAPRNPRAAGALAVFADPQGGGLTVGDAKEFVVAKLQDAGVRLQPQVLNQVPDDFLLALATPWARESLAKRGKGPQRAAPAGAGRQLFSDPGDPYGLKSLAERTRARYEAEEQRQGRQATAPAEPPAATFSDPDELKKLAARTKARYEAEERRRAARG